MTVPSWAVRGAKVACIRKVGSWSTAARGRGDPQPGQVYTLDGFIETAPSGEVYVGLVELDPAGCFKLELFRPVIEPKSEAEDLATFRKWLRVDQPVDA